VKFWVVFVLFARSSCLEFFLGVLCWVQEVRPPLVAGLTAPRPLGGVLVFAKIVW
jgi:hypothetical protein